MKNTYTITEFTSRTGEVAYLIQTVQTEEIMGAYATLSRAVREIDIVQELC